MYDHAVCTCPSPTVRRKLRGEALITVELALVTVEIAETVHSLPCDPSH